MSVISRQIIFSNVIKFEIDDITDIKNKCILGDLLANGSLKRGRLPEQLSLDGIFTCMNWTQPFHSRPETDNTVPYNRCPFWEYIKYFIWKYRYTLLTVLWSWVQWKPFYELQVVVSSCEIHTFLIHSVKSWFFSSPLDVSFSKRFSSWL